MKLLQVTFPLFLLVFLNISTAKAQDSARVVKLANAVLKNHEPEKVIYNKALLLKGEEGTDLNMGQKTYITLQAGTTCTITVVLANEEDEELNYSCGYNKGDAITETVTSVSDNVVITKSLKVDFDRPIVLDVKKTTVFIVFVGGRKLPAEGIYYKLIITKF
ncbi:hypothetical protein CAP36_01030 [Chitinophagaceae bacterium IBVUCB2]|nr:hypothetical protein CAP36_01030 [Chitinophagaceae bacterium IBVUCB2]